MNRIEIAGMDRMPTSMETWLFISDMVSVLSKLGTIAGIGVYALPGQNVNEGGYIIWDGEVLPLRSGSGAYVIKREHRNGVEHEGATYEYYVERYVEPSNNADGAVLISSIKTLPSLSEISNLVAGLQNVVIELIKEDAVLKTDMESMSAGLFAHVKGNNNPHRVTKDQVGLGDIPNAVSSEINLDNTDVLATAKAVRDLNKVLTELINKQSVVPSGTICMWSGKTAPAGWALCDGTNYTLANGAILKLPDLRGRFIVGYDRGASEYDQPGNRSQFLKQGYINDNDYPGKTGGEKAHTLTVDEIPAHSHKIWETGIHKPATDNDSTLSYCCMNPYHNGRDADYSSLAGSSQSHENRPPYYVLAYIIKL